MAGLAGSAWAVSEALDLAQDARVAFQSLCAEQELKKLSALVATLETAVR